MYNKSSSQKDGKLSVITAYNHSSTQVKGPSRAEETQSHVYRMYFMGPNTFREPWHLPYSPPDEIVDIV